MCLFRKKFDYLIIKYIDSFYYDQNDKKSTLRIIMEYADSGDLRNSIKKYTNNQQKINENLIWYYFIHLCFGIQYMHSKNRNHRDIKCQNIFIFKNDIIKLGVLGISKILLDSSDFAKTDVGTTYFLSPEIIAGNKYDKKVDIWMLGCVLYELINKKRPFDGDNFNALMMNIQYKEYLLIKNKNNGYSDDLIFLVDICWIKNPQLRPKINEILAQNFIQEKIKFYKFNNLNTNNKLINNVINIQAEKIPFNIQELYNLELENWRRLIK